jgi:hypothetical protein
MSFLCKTRAMGAHTSRMLNGTKQKPIFFFAMTALIGVFTGCQTTVKTAPQRGGSEYKSWLPIIDRSTQTGGAILLAHQALDPAKTIGAEGCRLRVENQDTGKSLFLTVKPTEPGVLVGADPGHYVARRLGCGISSVWNLEDLYGEAFTVEKDQVSYIGKLIFSFDAKGNLESVKKGSRIENSESLALLLLQVAKGADGHLLSGFTARPITHEMLDGAKREGFDVFALGVRPAEQQSLNPLLEKLKMCSNEAGKTDPLRFGELEYVAIYNQGRFDSIRDRKDNNAFSDSFRGCVEKSLQTYNMTSPAAANSASRGQARVRVRY